MASLTIRKLDERLKGRLRVWIQLVNATHASVVSLK